MTGNGKRRASLGSRRIVVLGYGTIAEAALPMLLETLEIEAPALTVIDRKEPPERLSDLAGRGLTYLRREVTPDNLGAVLGEALRPGDLLLNLSVGIDSITVSDWCQRHGALYVDTAIEPWDGHVEDLTLSAAERTEYALHQRARACAQAWDPKGPTAVITHGANPGLVSHFAKAALIEVADAMGLAGEPSATRDGWARLAKATGTKVIHISERDTQRSDDPKRPGEFVNTWSIPGFIEEAMMPVEIGWGTHERRMPAGAAVHEEGPSNTIFLEKPGGQYLLYSWVPSGGQILGLSLPHSETITLSDYLTLREEGRVAYRPTVTFVYLPCDDAFASLHEVRMRGWEEPEEERILMEELVGGQDELGVLLLGHGQGGWWYGSQLSVEEARALVPHSNPTAIQVAAGVLAAALWALENPNEGFCEPEALPHDAVLQAARPYLGRMVSRRTSWHPLKQRKFLFDNPDLENEEARWQFDAFRPDKLV
jgi:homospermidine synthase